jgi:hypothetical protein
MGALALDFSEEQSPIDRVERLAELRRWPMERTSDDEVVMTVTGQWCSLHLSLSWSGELESLHVACSYDLRVPSAREAEVLRLLAQINARLLHGHFDLWPTEGLVTFRHGLILAGGADANDAQCDAMIRAGVESCQRYFPAFQFVVWAGQRAEDALQNALLETHGQA